jgi:outer membrane protein TolC
MAREYYQFFRIFLRRGITATLFLIVLVGCTPAKYQTRADHEAYGVMFEKTSRVENVEPESVVIDVPYELDLAGFPTYSGGEAFLGPYSSAERGAKQLSLDDALFTAVTQGRDYLFEKEQVYLAALDLTLARYRLAPVAFAGALGRRATDSRDAVLQAQMTELVSTNTFSRTQSAGFNWLLQTGARISTDFTQDFLRIMTGNQSFNESDLAVSIVQPLLQGGGATVTLEALTQEERNLLYDLRDFADFRRAYIVGVATGYYNVLRSRDQARNNYLNYQGFLKNVGREEAFAEEDRRTQSELGQLRQASLVAQRRWLDSVQTYLSRLDAFKISIGLPVSEKIVLDTGSLRQLRMEAPDITQDQAVQIALATRPDLATAADLVEDATRRIGVAENGLLPGLDLSLDYDATSDPGDTTPALNADRRRWRSSLDVDLPLDRKAERNRYRASQIIAERAQRAEELSRDRATLQIYEAWRSIEQARRNFDISEISLALAERRLEEQLLLADLGKGRARDLVDAQEDLVDAQNSRTATLIDHTLARLRLWRDMGILYIQGDGKWAVRLSKEPPLGE